MTAPGVPSQRAAWSRKLIHLSTASLPVIWAYGIVDVTTVRVLLAGALGAALGVEWGRRVSPAFRARFEALAGPLLKPHEALAITGATWLALAMFVAVVVFPASAARAALWAGAIGDSAAALAGQAWQARAGRARSEKSFVGSAACAAGTALGAVWLGGATLLVATLIGLVAAMAEWPRRPGDDNLRVTLVAGGAAWLLGVA